MCPFTQVRYGAISLNIWVINTEHEMNFITDKLGNFLKLIFLQRFLLCLPYVSLSAYLLSQYRITDKGSDSVL